MPSLFNALSSSLPTAVGNTLGSIQQKISEVGREVANTFGGAGPLTRLQATGSTIQEAAAQVTTQAAQFSGAIPRQDAINAMSGLAASNPATFNATTMLEAARGADSNVQQVSAAQIESAKQENNYDDAYKVRLVGIGKKDAEYELIFDVMPEVVEARNVSYEDVAPPQSIGAFQKFKGTDPVSWNVNATFVCRNIEEAGKNLQHLNQLRAWTMPFFGENTRKTFSTRLGAPPPTLIFSGWKQQMVGPTRVVITSLNWTFPRDVDYIAAKTEDGQIVPFPTVMTVAITLKESFSTEEFNNFDLNMFAHGYIPEAYGISVSSGNVVDSLNTVEAPSLSNMQDIPGLDVSIDSSSLPTAPYLAPLNTDDVIGPRGEDD